MNKAALIALAERCEKASGPDRKLDDALYPGRIGTKEPRIPRYSGSIDAAMTLLPKGFTLDIDATAPEMGVDATLHGQGRVKIKGSGDTIPLALCSAALRAISKGEGE